MAEIGGALPTQPQNQEHQSIQDAQLRAMQGQIQGLQAQIQDLQHQLSTVVETTQRQLKLMEADCALRVMNSQARSDGRIYWLLHPEHGKPENAPWNQGEVWEAPEAQIDALLSHYGLPGKGVEDLLPPLALRVNSESTEDFEKRCRLLRHIGLRC